MQIAFGDYVGLPRAMPTFHVDDFGDFRQIATVGTLEIWGHIARNHFVSVVSGDTFDHATREVDYD